MIQRSNEVIRDLTATTVAEADQTLGSYDSLLSSLSADPNLRGYQFETITEWLLKNDPKYSFQIKKIWRWDEWPEKWGADCGIDLVAETHSGELWAIQCKAYDPKYYIKKSDVDSFLTESNRSCFSFRLLASTTSNLGITARKTISGQEKQVGLLLGETIKAAAVNWPRDIGELQFPAGQRLDVFRPREHQVKAISRVVKGFQQVDRGKVIHPCGAGKTLTGMWIAQALRAESTLIAVPSLALIQQTLSNWARHYGKPFKYLVVCSDDLITPSFNDDPALCSASMLGVPVTTDPREVQKFLTKPTIEPKIVFSTYQSLESVSLAQRNIKHKFDFGIADEAHVCTGIDGGMFTLFTDAEKLSVKKRLFLTATERMYSANIKEKAEECDLDVVSMDDEVKFGPAFDKLSFKEAIEQGLLTDYRVIVGVITKQDVMSAIRDGQFYRLQEGLKTDARTLATQIALLKALEKYDINKVISFHRTVARAKSFVSEVGVDSLYGIQSLMQPEDDINSLHLFHINGNTPANIRTSILDHFALLPTGERAILSNCSVLGVGVDIAPVDCVAFCDPKRSTIDIAQAVGRAMRLSPGKDLGYVFVPVFLDEDSDPEIASRSAGFDLVWDVIRALRAHDETLAVELDQARSGIGRTSLSSSKFKLPDNIVLDLPENLPLGFQDAIHLRALELTAARPKITKEILFEACERYYEKFKEYPSLKSPLDPQLGYSWGAISMQLRRGILVNGYRGTLKDFISNNFPTKLVKPIYDKDKIKIWERLHERRTGDKPHPWSGRVVECPRVDWRDILENPWELLRKDPEKLKSIIPFTLNEIKVLILRDLQRDSPKWPALKLSDHQRFAKYFGSDECISPPKTLGQSDARYPDNGETIKSLAEMAHLLLAVKGIEFPNWSMARGKIKIEFLLEYFNYDPEVTENYRRILELITVCNADSEFVAKLNKSLANVNLTELQQSLNLHRIVYGKNPLPDETRLLKIIDGKLEQVYDSWRLIDFAFKNELRGITTKSSLDQFSSSIPFEDPPFSKLLEEQIIFWAELIGISSEPYTHYQRFLRREKVSFDNHELDLTWGEVDNALKNGERGLQAGIGLDHFLQEKGLKVRGAHKIQPITIDDVIHWIKTHFSQFEGFPTIKTKTKVDGQEYSWKEIDSFLRFRSLGLSNRQNLSVPLNYVIRMLSENREEELKVFFEKDKSSKINSFE
ncbi:MAG: DEAD/DEAH box helicase family protein [Bdellovibrionota bacterium]